MDFYKEYNPTSYELLHHAIGEDGVGCPCRESKSTAVAMGNFDSFADIDILLSSALFIPMLNVVYCLMKLTQIRDIFVCNFMQSIKVCQNELTRMFIDPSTAYNTVEFA